MTSKNYKIDHKHKGAVDHDRLILGHIAISN